MMRGRLSTRLSDGILAAAVACQVLLAPRGAWAASTKVFDEAEKLLDAATDGTKTVALVLATLPFIGSAAVMLVTGRLQPRFILTALIAVFIIAAAPYFVEFVASTGS